MLHLRALRKLIGEFLRTDSDLQAFCVDYFPHVAHRFTNGMDRVDKVTTLLTHAAAQQISLALREEFPDAAPRIEHLSKVSAPADETSVRASPTLETAGRIVHVPELPPHFLDRADEVARLKRLVLGAAEPDVVVTDRAIRVGVEGMGGAGKTVLAASFARDREVRRAFPDGIFWVTLGQNPPLLQRQSELHAMLGATGGVFEDEQQGKARLTELLTDRACIIVLDDAWHIDHITAFGTTGPAGRVLFTTRDAGIAAGWSAKVYRIEMLTDDQALKLLGDWSNQPAPELPAEAHLVIQECGRLPLALAMIGATIRGRPERWSNALHKLRSADLTAIRRSFPNYPYPDLSRAIEVSLDVLDPASRERYLDFAVFPEDAHVPESVLKLLWKEEGLNPDQTEDLLDLFVDRSLLRRDERGWLNVHDLQRDYLIKHTDRIRVLHTRLLCAYAAQCSGDWASGPDDGYFFQYLAYHLVGAACCEDLHRLLLDLEWLRARLKATDPIDLLGDFARLRNAHALPVVDAEELSVHLLCFSRALRLAKDPEKRVAQLLGRLREECASHIDLLGDFARLRNALAPPVVDGDPLTRVEGAIRLSAHILAQDREQLVAQLLGRLGEESDFQIEALRASGVQSQRGIWLRPLATCLTPPGGPLVRTLSGHSRAVERVAVTPDGRWVVSGSRDNTLKVWELHSGRELRTLSGHSNWVTAVAVTPDARWIVSGSLDKTIRVWRLGSGRGLHTLSGHSDSVTAVAVTPDGRWIVSGSSDRTLKVWELHTGRELRTLSGHSKLVRAVAVIPDGARIVSGSDDGTLKIWELHSGTVVRTLLGHSRRVSAVAVTPDSKWIVSTSTDTTLKVWETDSGRELYTLENCEGVYQILTRDKNATKVAEQRIVDVPSSYAGPWRRSRRVGEESSAALGAGARPSRKVETRSLSPDSLLAVAVTPDGRFAVFGSFDKTLQGWDLENRKALCTLVGHSGAVNGVAVTPDGRFAVSGSDDTTLKIWELPSRELSPYSRRLGTIRALAITPDTRRVVSGSDDRATITVWELQSRRESCVFAGHSRWVSALAVTPDGDRYARCLGIQPKSGPWL